MELRKISRLLSEIATLFADMTEEVKWEQVPLAVSVPVTIAYAAATEAGKACDKARNEE